MRRPHDYTQRQAQRARTLWEWEQNQTVVSDADLETWHRIGVGMTGRAYFYDQWGGNRPAVTT